MRLDKENVKKRLSTAVTDLLTEEDQAGAGQEQNPAAAAAA